MKGIMKGNSPLNITFDDRGRNKAKSTMKTTFGRTKGSMALPHGLTFDNSSQFVSKNTSNFISRNNSNSLLPKIQEG